MPDITVASTTDDQTEVDRVAGATPAPIEPEVPEEKPEETPPPPEPPKPKEPEPSGKLQKRIDKLTAQKTAAETRAEQLQRELEAERAAKAAAKPAPVAEQPQEATLRPRPKLGETINPATGKVHETQEEYEDDLLNWRDEQRELKAMQEAEKEAVKEVWGSYQERVEQFKATVDDWDEVVGNPKLEIYPGVQTAILQLENGPEMAYFLGSHADIAKKLLNMSEERAIAEVGRLSAKIEKETPEPPQNARRTGPDKLPVSSAPAPIKPLSGHSTRNAVSLADPDLDYREYRKIRDQQEKERWRR